MRSREGCGVRIKPLESKKMVRLAGFEPVTYGLEERKRQFLPVMLLCYEIIFIVQNQIDSQYLIDIYFYTILSKNMAYRHVYGHLI